MRKLGHFISAAVINTRLVNRDINTVQVLSSQPTAKNGILAPAPAELKNRVKHHYRRKVCVKMIT